LLPSADRVIGLPRLAALRRISRSNAFKHIAASYSAVEKAMLFACTASSSTDWNRPSGQNLTLAP